MSDSAKLRHYLAPKYWPTWLALGMMRLVALLPLRLIELCGALLGKLLYIALPKRRRVADINLKIAFPDASDEKIIHMRKQCFSNLGIAAF